LEEIAAVSAESWPKKIEGRCAEEATRKAVAGVPSGNLPFSVGVRAALHGEIDFTLRIPYKKENHGYLLILRHEIME
jgi:hypothetical protein